MSASRKCQSCGARPSRNDAGFCDFCGTELPPLEIPEARVEVHQVGPYGDLDARFAAIDEHENLERLMSYTPSMAGTSRGMYCGVAFGVVFVVIALIITAFFQGLPFPASLFPLIFVAVGIGIVVTSLKKAAAFSAAPLKRLPALIIDERTAVSGGSGNSAARSSYYITLQFQDDPRHEYAVGGKMAGILTRGDMGIAYVKSDTLVAFKTLSV